MKNSTTWAQRILKFTCATAIVLGTACSTEELALTPDEQNADLKVKTTAVESQLERLTQKMQRFHNFQVAQAQGFVAVSPYIPHMGIHFGQLDRFDAEFILEEPEILLYVPEADGSMRFVAVEYAVPVALAPTPPEGFVGDSDHWEFNPVVAGGSWVLHAWIVEENPDGVFAPMNPNIPATPSN